MPDAQVPVVTLGLGSYSNRVRATEQAPGMAALEKLGVKVSAKQYPGLQHSVDGQVIQDVSQFMSAVVKGEEVC